MNTDQLIQLPDGTWAVVHRGISWGEATIILLLVVLVFLQVYQVWRSHR